jgi:hypothetical protein
VTTQRPCSENGNEYNEYNLTNWLAPLQVDSKVYWEGVQMALGNTVMSSTGVVEEDMDYMMLQPHLHPERGG